MSLAFCGSSQIRGIVRILSTRHAWGRRNMMPIDEAKTVVRDFVDALSEGNFAALSVHPGLYQTVQRQPLVRAAFPDLTITVEQQVGEGDTIATRATMRGTHAGTFMG